MSMESYVSSKQVEQIVPERNGAVTVSWKDQSKTKHIKPRRLFPLTGKTTHINFLDGRNKEVFILDNMKGLDKRSKRTLHEALNRYYIIPKIHAILDITLEFGIHTWTVRTDKGLTSFDVRRPSVDVKMLSKKHVVVKDMNDNSYEIPDISQLDRTSMRWLEEQL